MHPSILLESLEIMKPYMGQGAKVHILDTVFAVSGLFTMYFRDVGKLKKLGWYDADGWWYLVIAS